MPTWLNDLLKSTAFSTTLKSLILIVVSFFAARYGFPPAVNTTNNTVVAAPDLDPGFLATKAAAPQVTGGLHPKAHFYVRAHLALALMERDNLGIVEAFAKVRKVSHDDLEDALTTAAVQMKVVGQLGDGTWIQKIIDFLNSPQGQALIALLLKLLPLLLADGHDALPWLPFDDVRTVRGPPYPLAWEIPCTLAS